MWLLRAALLEDELQGRALEVQEQLEQLAQGREELQATLLSLQNCTNGASTAQAVREQLLQELSSTTSNCRHLTGRAAQLGTALARLQGCQKVLGSSKGHELQPWQRLAVVQLVLSDVVCRLPAEQLHQLPVLQGVPVLDAASQETCRQSGVGTIVGKLVGGYGTQPSTTGPAQEQQPAPSSHAGSVGGAVSAAGPNLQCLSSRYGVGVDLYSRQCAVDWAHDELAAEGDAEDVLDDEDDEESTAVVEAITTVLSSNFYTPRTSLSLENRRSSGAQPAASAGAASTNFDGSFAMKRVPQPSTAVMHGKDTPTKPPRSPYMTSWSSMASSSTITALGFGSSSVSSGASAGMTVAAAAADAAAGFPGIPRSLAASKELGSSAGHGVPSNGAAACVAVSAGDDAAGSVQHGSGGKMPSCSSSDSLKTACSALTDAEADGSDWDEDQVTEAGTSVQFGGVDLQPTAARSAAGSTGSAAGTQTTLQPRHSGGARVGDTAVDQVLPAGTALEMLTVGQLLQLLTAAVTMEEQTGVAAG
eukprot:gene4468-4724_t